MRRGADNCHCNTASLYLADPNTRGTVEGKEIAREEEGQEVAPGCLIQFSKSEYARKRMHGLPGIVEACMFREAPHPVGI